MTDFPTCDLCGTKQDDLGTLLSIYQTDGVKSLCDACVKDVEETFERTRLFIPRIVQRWIRRRRKESGMMEKEGRLPLITPEKR